MANLVVSPVYYMYNRPFVRVQRKTSDAVYECPVIADGHRPYFWFASKKYYL